ncbi:MAG TPA: dihydroorotate dehydrogenase electron transfer subunit [Candidatus Scatosoma pullicola]|nr:dihydroorotate dehydrogenase electron transfer subunit [Candidatus Scatosoma pullicola]
MKDYRAEILSDEQIAQGVYELVLRLPGEVKVRAGQFASVGVRGHLLRRPFAICKAEGERISLCFQVRGEGTRNLASMGAGESLQVLMPLGNGFFVERDEKRVALVGGGVGIFPMIAALREYAPAKEVFAYIGFRNKEAVCGLEEFERAARLKAVTDDGSYGEKKNAVQAFEEDLRAGIRPDVVLSCGPLPMLRALKEVLEREKLPGFASLEERMGCGIGACLVCVCDLTDGQHARVCKDGPVFPIGDVVL